MSTIKDHLIKYLDAEFEKQWKEYSYQTSEVTKQAKPIAWHFWQNAIEAERKRNEPLTVVPAIGAEPKDGE